MARGPISRPDWCRVRMFGDRSIAASEYSKFRPCKVAHGSSLRGLQPLVPRRRRGWIPGQSHCPLLTAARVYGILTFKTRQPAAHFTRRGGPPVSFLRVSTKPPPARLNDDARHACRLPNDKNDSRSFPSVSSLPERRGPVVKTARWPLAATDH